MTGLSNLGIVDHTTMLHRRMATMMMMIALTDHSCHWRILNISYNMEINICDQIQGFVRSLMQCTSLIYKQFYHRLSSCANNWTNIAAQIIQFGRFHIWKTVNINVYFLQFQCVWIINHWHVYAPSLTAIFWCMNQLLGRPSLQTHFAFYQNNTRNVTNSTNEQ